MKTILFALAALAACGKDSAPAKSEPAAASKPEAPKPEASKPEAPKPEPPKPEPPKPEAAAKPEAPRAEASKPVDVPTAADFEDRVRDVTAKNVDVHLRALEDELAP